MFFLHLAVACQLCGAGLVLLYHALGITLLEKELASMGLGGSGMLEPTKACCVRVLLPSAESSIVALPLLSVLTILEGCSVLCGIYR